MSSGRRSQKTGGARPCNQQAQAERQESGSLAPDPFDEVISSIDKSKLITVGFLVALFKAQDIATRLYFEDLLKEKNDQINDLQIKVDRLESRVDDLEQYGRRYSIKLSGVAESVSESPASFLKEKLSVEIDELHDIDRYHRVGRHDSNGKPRDILIKFTNYRTKAAVFKNRFKLKGTGCFVNDDLTRKRSKLLFKCRTLKKQSSLKDTWTRDGNVFIKLNDNSTKRISSLEELADI